MRVVRDGVNKWFVAKDICRALGFKGHSLVMSSLDDDEQSSAEIETAGGKQRVRTVSEAGVYRLLLASHMPYAKTYQRWVAHEILPALFSHGRYGAQANELGARIDRLEQMLRDSGVVKPFVNPRYTFDNLKTRYIAAVAGSRARDFYDAVGEWYGVKVPYARSLSSMTVKEWILQSIPLDAIQEFVVGIESHTIVRSRAGYWVSLNGVFGNATEWDKIKREFGSTCAYCGKKHVPLLAEHVIPQSQMAKQNPACVDLVENIVPTCAECNASKNTREWKSWYKAQPFFDKKRLAAIQNHIKRYHVDKRG